MDQPLKLFSEIEDKNDEDRKIFKLVDFKGNPKLKANDMEKRLESFKYPKHPSFHEIIGPILAGFASILLSFVVKLSPKIPFSRSVFWKFANIGRFGQRFHKLKIQMDFV